jgi:cell wall-associated NlpC family hydrolase
MTAPINNTPTNTIPADDALASTGASTGSLDPRRHAYRPDLADEALRGKVLAPRYTKGEAATILRTSVPLRKQPVYTAPFETEALFGEAATIFDSAEGWAWVQLAGDRYVGYVPADALVMGLPPPTHRVKSTGTFIYPEPEIKTPPLLHLSLNSAFAVASSSDRFYELSTGGFVVARHVAEIGWRDRDFVEVAERFLGTPYLWGGKSRIGIDCSGLIQVAMQACGFNPPRDSDLQRAEIGIDVMVPADLDGLQRGDIVCWPGHVGIMADGVMLLHANAHHMAVAIEPLPEAAARIKASTGKDVSAIRRVSGLTS